LILVASCNVHYRAWRSPLKILGGVLTMRALGNIFGYVPGKQVGFGGREARGVIIDWSNNCMRGTYRLLNSSVDYHEKMAAVQRPVFALTFENDWLAPKEAAENLYRCLSSATVEHTHIEKNDPDFIDVSHFNWARRPKGAMKYIERWLATL
ncbi:MAG: alpha/beta hydrolase, partial [Myxococcota bacterium]